MKVIGYKKAKAFLESGELLYWHRYPASFATIAGCKIRYDAYLELTDETRDRLITVSNNGNCDARRLIT